MTAPKADIYQMQVMNPGATMPLIIPVLVVCNTSDEDLFRNIEANAARQVEWVAFAPEHVQTAVLVGGGPSVADHLDDIRALADAGATIFAMNAASWYLRRNGIAVDFQVIADAKPETAHLVDHGAIGHLIASQVDPDTLEAVLTTNSAPRLWHLGIDGMEDRFPADRRRRGGYALIGGGAAVGNSALCLAYVLGYRWMKCFGYDSSHRGDASHAYDQPMNRFIPTLPVEWAGRRYTASVAMKAQAEKFQITAQRLEQHGCSVDVFGEGLLPAMFNTPAGDMTERDKYRLMWQFDGYRDYSPGADAVETFMKVAIPHDMVIDFGCGTGRASVIMHRLGVNVFLIDFADNCRDAEAMDLPFLEWDLSTPVPARAPHGFCTDVMEHIPTAIVPKVLANILEAAGTVFFQISTVVDAFGDVIGQRLHQTVQPHEWWADAIGTAGGTITWEECGPVSSSFLVTRDLSDRKHSK